jgi:hypothetical protein
MLEKTESVDIVIHQYYKVVMSTQFIKDRLRDNPKFQEFVKANLWENRRENGWSWNENVIDFIKETYKDWLPKDLYRSDFRGLDDKLYARINKFLHEQNDDDKKVALLEDSGLLAEFGEAAIKRIGDPVERAATGALRGYHRARTAKYRAKQNSRKLP